MGAAFFLDSRLAPSEKRQTNDTNLTPKIHAKSNAVLTQVAVPSPVDLARSHRLFERCATLLPPQARHWAVRTSALEKAADTLIWPLRRLFGDRGPLFPSLDHPASEQGEPEAGVPYADELVEADAVSAGELLLASMAACPTPVPNPVPKRDGEPSGEVASDVPAMGAAGMARRARKAARCLGQASLWMCHRPSGLGSAIRKVREALQCVPQGRLDADLRGGLLAVAGKIYVTAFQTGELAGWDKAAGAGEAPRWEGIYSCFARLSATPLSF